MPLGGTGIGLIGVGMAFHAALGNPDVGRDARMILVADKLVASCYSDDLADACAARLRGKVGDVMEKLRKLDATTASFEEDFWQADDAYTRVMLDIGIALDSEIVASASKVKLKAAQSGLAALWTRKVKEGVDAHKLPQEMLDPANVVASAG